MPEYELIEVERVDGVSVVRLNRPKTLNALSQALVRELDGALDEVQRAEGSTGVVLSTTSDRAFSAGADTKEIATLTKHQFTLGNRKGAELFQRIEEFHLPVVAAVRGYALGGGFELALSCDARFAAENAVFGLPEVKIGFIPGWGGVRRLSAVTGAARAKHLVLSGTMLGAAQAESEGIVSGPVGPDPEGDAIRFIEALPEQARRSIGYVKHLFARMVDETDSAGIETLFMTELLREEH